MLYNVHFLSTLTKEKCFGLFKHECYHLILDHCTNRSHKDKDLWNIAEHGFRNLKPSEISLTAKHVEAMKRISECENDFGLILEDDIITIHGFTDLLNEYYLETPDDWDVIFIGNGYGINVPADKVVPGKKVYLADHPASRCTEAMLVKKSAATKLYNSMTSVSGIR